MPPQHNFLANTDILHQATVTRRRYTRQNMLTATGIPCSLTQVLELLFCLESVAPVSSSTAD